MFQWRSRGIAEEGVPAVSRGSICFQGAQLVSRAFQWCSRGFQWLAGGVSYGFRTFNGRSKRFQEVSWGVQVLCFKVFWGSSRGIQRRSREFRGVSEVFQDVPGSFRGVSLVLQKNSSGV